MAIEWNSMNGEQYCAYCLYGPQSFSLMCLCVCMRAQNHSDKDCSIRERSYRHTHTHLIAVCAYDLPRLPSHRTHTHRQTRLAHNLKRSKCEHARDRGLKFAQTTMEVRTHRVDREIDRERETESRQHTGIRQPRTAIYGRVSLDLKLTWQYLMRNLHCLWFIIKYYLFINLCSIDCSCNSSTIGAFLRWHLRAQTTRFACVLTALAAATVIYIVFMCGYDH